MTAVLGQYKISISFAYVRNSRKEGETDAFFLRKRTHEIDLVADAEKFFFFRFKYGGLLKILSNVCFCFCLESNSISRSRQTFYSPATMFQVFILLLSAAYKFLCFHIWGKSPFTFWFFLCEKKITLLTTVKRRPLIYRLLQTINLTGQWTILLFFSLSLENNNCFCENCVRLKFLYTAISVVGSRKECIFPENV